MVYDSSSSALVERCGSYERIKIEEKTTYISQHGSSMVARFGDLVFSQWICYFFIHTHTYTYIYGVCAHFKDHTGSYSLFRYFRTAFARRQNASNGIDFSSARRRLFEFSRQYTRTQAHKHARTTNDGDHGPNRRSRKKEKLPEISFVLERLTTKYINPIRTIFGRPKDMAKYKHEKHDPRPHDYMSLTECH